MDGSVRHFSEDIAAMVDMTPQTVLRKSIIGKKIIALVSLEADFAWTGFNGVAEVLEHKHQYGLGEAWRIMDRRQSCVDQGQTAYAEVALNIGSMISDRIRSFVTIEIGEGKIPAQARKEMMMFASSLLREIAITSDGGFGTWHPMRGKFIQNGMAISHSWLEDDEGNILDILPWNYQVSPAKFVAADSERSACYDGFARMHAGYGTQVGSCLRGEQGRDACPCGAAQMKRGYETLALHISRYLEASELRLSIN